MEDYYYKRIPAVRVASFDVYAVGQSKHHIAALLEFDVTAAREKLKLLKASGETVSFNAWLIKVISSSICEYPEVASFLYSERKLIVFRDINISVLVEKETDGVKVPIPMVIKKTNEKSVAEITHEINEAKNSQLSSKDVVINKKPDVLERLYYLMPGFIRRLAWKIILRSPKFAYHKMGNVVVTSPGMFGKLNGWFIHKSVHPVSFGIGSIIKKPVVIDNEILIREILHITILIDHDVIDGAPMARFLRDLTKNIESGTEL